MKHIIIFLLLSMAVICHAQDHLRFLGCPITGDMKTFVDQMKSKGLATAVHRSWFKGMKTKFLNGSFWNFPDCDIVVRQPKKYNNVTSVYIHPHSNFLLLNDLISVLDDKYGQHTVQYPTSDVNAMNYVWNIPEGCVLIYATTTYGQAFDIMYRDYTEVRMLKAYSDAIDDEL